jgi:hypothetical protein
MTARKKNLEKRGKNPSFVWWLTKFGSLARNANFICQARRA